METTLKSAVLKKILSKLPKLMNKDAIRTLTASENAVFSFDDGSEAIDIVASHVDEKFDDELLSLFPNVKRSAELEIAKNIDRNLYTELTDKIFELNTITAKIDTKYGTDVDFLLDEIYTIAGVDKETCEKIRNAKVTLQDINSSSIKL